MELLESSGYAGQAMTFNGTNSDRRSAEIYETWKQRHAGEDIVTGSKEIDIRAALIEHFRETASIMIATEAAAEGVNLQFCSLVVNYDLPWNPQRIEQRIGRCHRYGQKHDVVVINFLNRRNEADQRVFQLLSEKFRLFDGVFGASDEVLGALESGVDFERRIADIYQNCRTPAEIDAAFDALQGQLEEEIGAKMATARSTLLENFDEDVRTRLRNVRNQTDRLDRFCRWLWLLTQHELALNGLFAKDDPRFELMTVPAGCETVPIGVYRLITNVESAEGAHAYRAGHPLAQFVLDQALERPLSVGKVVFRYSETPGKISLVEQLVGRSGILALSQVTVSALETEDHLVFAAFDDSGEQIDQETCEKLFEVGGEIEGSSGAEIDVHAKLDAALGAAKDAALVRIAERNGHFFEEEIEKLERWAEDIKDGLEEEIKALDVAIKTAKRDAKLKTDLEAKVALHRIVKDLEAARSQKRRSLYEAQDEIDRRKDELISGVEAKLRQRVESKKLFTIGWAVH